LIIGHEFAYDELQLYPIQNGISATILERTGMSDNLPTNPDLFCAVVYYLWSILFF